MNMKEIMIIVKGKDKTESIKEFKIDIEAHKIEIVYNKGKSYRYNDIHVNIQGNPIEIEIGDRAAYVDGMPIYNLQCVLAFGNKLRVGQFISKNKSIRYKTIDKNNLVWVENYIGSDVICKTLEYLKEISEKLPKKSEDSTFLSKEMEKLEFVHPDSVLKSYLTCQSIEKKQEELKDIIFPFRVNLSQKRALEVAFLHKISIIKGPPGTGKTQTILNIIVNLIMQKKSVAVVSNNNEAVKNVNEKMQKQGYGFLTALLGNQKNQECFFANMPLPKLKNWNHQEVENEIVEKIRDLSSCLNKSLKLERKKVEIKRELENWKLEQQHFEKYYSQQNLEKVVDLPLWRKTPDRILSFLADASVAKEYGKTDKFFYKVKLFFKYGVFDFAKLGSQDISILLSLQQEFYKMQITKIEEEIEVIEDQLVGQEFEETLAEYQSYSERLFQKYLYDKFSHVEHDFKMKNYKILWRKFLEEYPIILSSTYSLRKSIPQNYLLDYVIIDEASQVDLVTGVLVFSCCKNVIVVGDEKQLPQITDEKIKGELKMSSPTDSLDYFEHNILSSLLNMYGKEIPVTVLREHYRCHPKIIEFCNQKYYDGQLIPYTDSSISKKPLMIYKAAEGNHMRRVYRGEDKGIYNQRELDIIIEEVTKRFDLQESGDNIGIVTPYRKQADKASFFIGNEIQSDTVHKYQGREKEIMIMTTVLDTTKDGKIGMKFTDDANMINVAVSRAIKQFILVTDHKLFFENGENIKDLIRYIQYNILDENIVESEVISVFDLLYQRYSEKLLPLKAKINSGAKWKSEELLKVTLDDILEQNFYGVYTYTQGMLLRNLLNDTELLTERELKYVNNCASLDFVIFCKLDKYCVLVIEVDGFAYHENNPEQLEKDRMKDNILNKYGISILRLPTNGSGESEKIKRILKSQN